MAGEVRTRIVIDADSRQAVTALDQVDKAAAGADKTVGKLDGHDVDVNTSDATQALGKVETAADDAERAVRAVDGDTVELTTDTGKLDSATDDVTRLGRLAAEPLRINIDVDQAQVSRIRETGDHVKTVGERTEALQSGIGPLRGFTDELGASSAAAGTAANALVDAGEAAQIFGAQMGLSEKTLSRVSLGLGGIGLAVGVATFAWGKYKEAQRKAAEQTEKMIAVQEQLADGKYAEAASSLADEYGDLFKRLQSEGLSAAEVMDIVTGKTDGLADTTADLSYESIIGLSKMRQAFIDAGVEVEWTKGLTSELTTALGGAGQKGTDEFGRIEGAARDVEDAISRIKGELSDDRALLNFGQKSNDVLQKFREGVGLSLFDVQDWKEEIVNVAEALGTVPDDVIVDLLAQSDDGLTEAEVLRTQQVINQYASARPVKWPVFLDTAGLSPPKTPPMIAAPSKPGTRQFVQNVTVNATPGMREVDAVTARWLRVNGSG
jgi:hypothetical protein